MAFLQQIANKFRPRLPNQETHAPPESVGYGTFFGVYLPSILSIFGVIMYLRLGVILGKLGLVPTLSIVILSSLITFLTSLSISSISTNMKVEKGGAYYMISRCLGIDFGTALGIPIYLAQAIGIAFYLLGFSETLCASFPELNSVYVSIVTLLVLGILGFFSTTIVLKTQLLIFLVIIASLCSVFFGNPIPYSTMEPVGRMGYWTGFAIFFPAVTGILSGVSMSGDLKDPRKSLPLGTIGAVLTGFVVYVLLVLFLWSSVPRQLLVKDTMICEHIARYGSLVILGIWGATLSSALGSILGAPRTLQALAEDGIVFKFLGKSIGKNKEPKIASLFTIVLTACFLFFGKIDSVAPILTMFFLISYCILNLVAGIETLMHNPSWRPSFTMKPWVYFTGAILCLIGMFMINAGATFLSLLIVLSIYFFRGRKLSSNWEDICFAILMQVTKSTAYRLKT
ncbi:MAG: amino acid permease [Chlamydiia bacterium]|nr:amino acid permease [Chlamydiia bacterium]